jgi:single-strand DNA-binding protein
MSSVNKCIIVGNLGSDPEVKFLPNGSEVCNFSVATSESWKDDSGEKQEKTEWHNVVAWKKLATLCGEYLAKGRKVYVEGKLETRSWDDKDGTKKYKTELVARDVVFLGSKNDG